MFRRLKQNVMVKLDMAKQTEFPQEVTRSISFCESSKSDVSGIAKSVEHMISTFKATGMTPADSISDICSALAVKTKNKKFNTVMKDIQDGLSETAKTERKTAERVGEKFLESWSKVWLKENLKTYLDDISELKKRRLDKDGLAQAAAKHPDDETKVQKSRDADARYDEQLAKVQQNINDFPEHFKKTAAAIRELMNIMADHYDKCANVTHERLKHAKSA